ncbi:MAG: hypothetical protein FWH06_00660 [Oscillospiraceae bacterium]|nr:hypothetical protein [Oscillospiraceae bacterium]
MKKTGIFLIITAILLLSLAACSGVDAAPTPSPAPTPAPQPTPSPTPQTVSYTQADLETAMANSKKGMDNFLSAYPDYVSGRQSLGSSTVSSSDPAGKFEGYWVWGSIKDGAPDGACSLYLSKGETAQYNSYDFTNAILGTFVNGKLNGLGYIKNSGFTYSGYFKDNKFDGKGIYEEQDQRWAGEWINGSFTGYGVVFNFLTEGSYSGYFENGVLQGLGSLRIDEGTWFGNFKDGELVMPLGFDKHADQERAADSSAMANAYA